jgi:GT2 family glycosyltransferase
MTDTKHGNTVAALVVTYNRRKLLAGCIDALLAQSHSLDAIYVVDNASSDGTDRLISERYADSVVYTRLSRNTGGAGGFCHGLNTLKDSEYRWVWIMDDDVEAAPNALQSLLDAADRTPESESDKAIVVPVRQNKDQSLDDSSGVSFDVRRWWILPNGVKRTVDRVYRSIGDLPPRLELHDFTFEGPLIPIEAVRNVGLPNPKYFIFGDDTDYSFRLLRCGCSLTLIRDAVMYRCAERRQAVNPWLEARQSGRIRNYLWLNSLYGETWPVRHVRPVVWISYCFAAALKRSIQHATLVPLRSFLWGTYGGLFGSPTYDNPSGVR